MKQDHKRLRIDLLVESIEGKIELPECSHKIQIVNHEEFETEIQHQDDEIARASSSEHPYLEAESNPPLKRRLEDIIYEEFDIYLDYERDCREATDPRERRKAEKEKEKQEKTIKENLAKYKSLCHKRRMPPAREIADIATFFGIDV